MKRRCMFSLVMVTVTAALSAVAFAVNLPEDAAVEITGETSECEDVADIGPEITTVPGPYVMEIESAEKPAKIPSEITDSMGHDTGEAYLLAKLAMAEAEGEDTEGKALVMLVVLNRVRDSKFPDTVEEVIYQTNQFSPIANGRFDKVEPDSDCWEALDLITDDKWDESRGATFFESKSKSTWHSKNLKFLFKHGNHYFYADRTLNN